MYKDKYQGSGYKEAEIRKGLYKTKREGDQIEQLQLIFNVLWTKKKKNTVKEVDSLTWFGSCDLMCEKWRGGGIEEGGRVLGDMGEMG